VYDVICSAHDEVEEEAEDGGDEEVDKDKDGIEDE
jgi:hypothetical protein